MPVSPIFNKSESSIMNRSPALAAASNPTAAAIAQNVQNMKNAVAGLTNTPKLSRRNSNISNLSYISGLSKSQSNISKAKMA